MQETRKNGEAEAETNRRISGTAGLSPIAQTLDVGDSPEELQLRRLDAEYRLIRKLGQGGLGSVWLARDEALDRSVAIKELNADKVSESALKRFQREARVTGQLDHPNIVTVHQFGADCSTGKTFYAMRFVGKKTLADAITEYHEQLEANDDSTPSLNQLLNAFQMVCRAIAFAHSRGVVHRDLKPDNVALDNFGQVSVIDWGLAKSFNEPEYFDPSDGLSGSESLTLAERTAAGQILGTPLYMSPEQANGLVDEIDERTDVYGLGTILFQILVGKAPHSQADGDSTVSTPVGEILEAIIDRPSPNARQIRPDAPTELSAICSRAMSRRKSSRYASATDLADAVQGWIDGIADRTRRFELMKSQVREVEVRLAAVAVDISRDARFASSLPPIQGIIDAVENRNDHDSLDQWRPRLESIFSAMLRTNHDLQALSYSRITAEGAIELVRVQRNAGDATFIHSVPDSRLTQIENSEFLERLKLLDPGDVDFAIRACDRVAPRVCKADRRLRAVIPIFDEIAGTLFGFVGIEVDLTTMITDFLSSLQNASSSILVFDSEDQIWITRPEDLPCGGKIGSRTDLLEQCDRLSPIVNGSRKILEIESELVARRFPFGVGQLGFELFVVCTT